MHAFKVTETISFFDESVLKWTNCTVGNGNPDGSAAILPNKMEDLKKNDPYLPRDEDIGAFYENEIEQRVLSYRIR